MCCVCLCAELRYNIYQSIIIKSEYMFRTIIMVIVT